MDPVPTKRGHYRQYTLDDQLTALATLDEFHGSIAATSAATGIPEQTIRNWRDARVHIPSPELVQQEKLRRASRWDSIASAAQDVVLEKLPDANARDAAVIAGIATDKGLLLRGEATTITETRDDSRVALLAERYGRLRQPVVVQPIESKPLPTGEQPGQRTEVNEDGSSDVTEPT